MAAETLRELITQFGFEIDDQKLAEADSKVAKMSGRLKAMGDRAVAFGKTMSTRVTLPVLGLGAAMIKVASDAEETQNKFDAIFRGIEENANRTSKQLASAFGLSNTTAQELLGSTGDLLVGLNLSREEALSLSKDVVALSGDVASFKNVQGGTARAAEALTKALLGEREMLKTTFGTAVRETEVQERATKILMTRRDLTEQQAKALATLQIVTERNRDAIGDFAKTQGGFANQSRIVVQELKDLGIQFGRFLLPIAIKVIGVLRRMIGFFNGLSDTTKKTILVVLGLLAALGPTLIIFGKVAAAVAFVLPLIAKFIVLIKALGSAALLANAKLLLIPLAIAAIIAAVFLIAEDIASFLEGRDSVIGRMFIGLETVFNKLSDGFKNFGLAARAAIAVVFTPLRALIAAIKTGVDLINVLRGKTTVGQFFSQAAQNIGGIFNAGTTQTLGGALFGAGAPAGQGAIGGLASRARAAQAGTQPIAVAQSAELNVNVQGLPPEAAKEAAQASITDVLGGMFRETTRSARQAQER